jgi:hypothetical protein
MTAPQPANIALLEPREVPPEWRDVWEGQIAAWEAEDRAAFPAPGQNVFVGSSTFTLWNAIRQDLAPHPIIHRGYGGSNLFDHRRYVHRIVTPYRPAKVFVYGGDNDIGGGRRPELVLEDFQAFASAVHAALPHTVVHFVSVKPCPARWNVVDRVRTANAAIAAWIGEPGQRGWCRYIDVFSRLLGPDGKPVTAYLIEDGLHPSPAGYRVWADAIRPFLERA